MPLATLRGYTQDNNRKFFMTNEGVNYDVHDFPSSELGLKLGGYMMLSSTETILDEHDSDVDVDMTTLNRPHNFRHHPEVTNTFLFNFSFKKIGVHVNFCHSKINQ